MSRQPCGKAVPHACAPFLSIFFFIRVIIAHMSFLKNFLRHYGYILLAALLGLAAFLTVFGVEPLRVTGTAWLYRTNKNDITQHYSGWMFYRNSQWGFPLGIASDLGTPDGVSISYTDSIPIVSVFFKLLSPLLPERFQFFGIYAAVCFMLQGAFAAVLVNHFVKDKVFSVLGSLFFSFSSAMIEREFRHTALASHYLILAAMAYYFIFSARSRSRGRIPAGPVLVCLALGTHPYLFAMTAAVIFFAELRTARLTQDLRAPFCRFALYMCAACVFGILIGVFGTAPIEPEAGFGQYSLNLNALVNPVSEQTERWSAVIPALPITDAQRDGMYYFGLPALLTLAAVLMLNRRQLRGICSRQREYLILTALLTLYAVSNRVSFGGSVLFELPLPQVLLSLFNIFRSSARFFLVPYYSLYLLMLTLLGRTEGKRTRRRFIVLFAAALQILEITPAVETLRDAYGTRAELPELSAAWDEIAERCETVRVIDCVSDRPLAYWIADQGIATDMMISAPIHLNAYWSRTQATRDGQYQSFLNGEALSAGECWLFPTDTGTNRRFTAPEQLDGFIVTLRANYAGQADIEQVTNGHKNYWTLIPNGNAESISGAE